MNNLLHATPRKSPRISLFSACFLIITLMCSCASSQDYPYAVHTKKKRLNGRVMGSNVDPAYDAYNSPELYSSRRSEPDYGRAEISGSRRKTSSTPQAPTFKRSSRAYSTNEAPVLSSSRRTKESSSSRISFKRSKKVRGGACNGNTCTFK